jgi:hypothetical protein
MVKTELYTGNILWVFLGGGLSDMLTYLMLVVKQPLKTKIHCIVAPCQ